MKDLKYFRMNNITRFSVGFLIFLIKAALVFSSTQKPQEGDKPKISKEEILPVPSTSSTLALSPTSGSFSTSTLSLIDPSKVPERARMLVQTLTRRKDPEHEWYISPQGIMYHDIYIGDGKSITKGMAVHTIVRGLLENGTEIINTGKKPVNKSHVFTFGHGDTLMSFEQGVSSMRERGKRVIVIPPEFAYGEKGYKSQYVYIPPNSILIFEVSLMWIREPEWKKIDLFK